MDFSAFIIKILISAALGAVIGLERETSMNITADPEKEKMSGHLGGSRTYALIALLGALAGLVNSQLFLLISITFFVLIAIYYAVGSYMTRSTGLTTELAAVFTFLIGVFVSSEMFSTQIVVALTAILALILSLKQRTHEWRLGIKKLEIDAFLSYAIIALVVLPFLPNEPYFLVNLPGISTILGAYHIDMGVISSIEIINPFKLWFIVALITGIDVFGYFLNKITSEKKGVVLSGAVGGFISSTSTTQSLAQQSKTNPNTNQLVAAAIFANMTSFLQIFVLLAPLNNVWLVQLTPILLTIVVTATLLGFIFLKMPNRASEISQNRVASNNKPVFSLKPALKFAALLIGIRAITKTALVLFGEKGFLLSSIIASFTGIDAIVINLAELVNNELSLKTAIFTLLCVNATNLLSKSFYAYLQAKREFTYKFLGSMLIVILASFVAYLFYV